MCPSKVLQKMLEMRENTEGGSGSARGAPRRGSWIRTEQHGQEMLHLLDSGPHTFVAFLVAYHQNKQLIGEKGLLPCKLYLQNVKKYFKGKINLDALSYAPTIIWFLDWSDMDSILDCISLLGLATSAFVVITGCANMVLMAVLWVLYLSLVNVGQIWYSFGWESQLLETGFLGMFLCPLWTLSRLPPHTPPPTIVIWAFRWLIFRIMLGAGLIKIRGDRCWRELTCMDYHYETQPVPNPIAYFMHRSPWWFHRFETLVNHFIELLVPFFLLLGRRMSIVHGLLQILFQVLLIISGNLSFLNWLTMVPSIACFDDASLGFLFSSRRGAVKERVVRMQLQEAAGEQLPPRYGCYIRKVVNISLGLLIAYLSIPVVINLLSSRQVMNTSFNPLRIVNTYGAFGSITKERTEVILQATSSLDPNDPAAVWEEYDFKCKPGDLKRRPCFITPYHYRLDWLMWFAAFQVPLCTSSPLDIRRLPLLGLSCKTFHLGCSCRVCFEEPAPGRALGTAGAAAGGAAALLHL
ncbi:lipase maturation factor 1 isoform X3 [Patagioenas fasciata]|uniref:lipase maturation factor 1 isoform X3 n=1 Tax=Patagioenas fasciata TaxID=372321 RepID=UPI003A991E23